MLADCSVLRTPIILPDSRISWDYHPTFMLYRGGSRGLSPTYEQAHVGLDLNNLASATFGFGGWAGGEWRKS